MLREDVAEWFELDCDSPYMLLVANVQPARRRRTTAEEERLWGMRSSTSRGRAFPPSPMWTLRAHPDGPPRHALCWDIIEAFRRRTGCPVIVNTSFNVRDEPIVCTPEDAYRCFMRTEMDALVLEGACS